MLLSFVLLISACSPSSCITVNRINQIENSYINEKGDSFVDDLRVYKSVAGLSVDTKAGVTSVMASGFAVSKTLIATAAHFCLSVYEGNVRGELKEKVNMTIVHGNKLQEKKEALEILAMDEATDLCVLLSVHREGHGLTPLKLQRKYFSNVHIGDPAYTVGSPLGIFPAKSTGFVMIPNSDDKEPIANKRMFVNIPIFPGNSGSPLINRTGRVIGVIVAGTFPSNVAIAQRSDVLIKFLISVK